MAKAKSKGPKQMKIPGTERAVHKDVRSKAEELYGVRAERMELSKQEGRLAGELISLMKKHGLTEHREDGMVISVVLAEERVKVKKVSDDSDD